MSDKTWITMTVYQLSPQLYWGRLAPCHPIVILTHHIQPFCHAPFVSHPSFRTHSRCFSVSRSHAKFPFCICSPAPPLLTHSRHKTGQHKFKDCSRRSWVHVSRRSDRSPQEASEQYTTIYFSQDRFLHLPAVSSWVIRCEGPQVRKTTK